MDSCGYAETPSRGTGRGGGKRKSQRAGRCNEVDHAKDIWVGKANTRYDGGQGVGRKGRRDVGSAAEDAEWTRHPCQIKLLAGVAGQNADIKVAKVWGCNERRFGKRAPTAAA